MYKSNNQKLCETNNVNKTGIQFKTQLTTSFDWNQTSSRNKPLILSRYSTLKYKLYMVASSIYIHVSSPNSICLQTISCKIYIYIYNLFLEREINKNVLSNLIHLVGKILLLLLLLVRDKIKRTYEIVFLNFWAFFKIILK